MNTHQSTENEKAKLIAYQDVFECFRHIGDFRIKLMTLLPLSSGGIISILSLSNTNSKTLRLVAIFGLIVSLGVFLYDLRAAKQCYSFVTIGQKLEEDFNFNPEISSFAKIKSFRGIIGASIPGYIIYISTIIFWVFIALKPELFIQK